MTSNILAEAERADARAEHAAINAHVNHSRFRPFGNYRSTAEQRQAFLESVYSDYAELHAQTEELQDKKHHIDMDMFQSNSKEIHDVLFGNLEAHEAELGDWDTWEKVEAIVKKFAYGRTVMYTRDERKYIDALLQRADALTDCLHDHQKRTAALTTSTTAVHSELSGLLHLLQMKDSEIRTLTNKNLTLALQLRQLKREIAELNGSALDNENARLQVFNDMRHLIEANKVLERENVDLRSKLHVKFGVTEAGSPTQMSPRDEDNANEVKVNSGDEWQRDIHDDSARKRLIKKEIPISGVIVQLRETNERWAQRLEAEVGNIMCRLDNDANQVYGLANPMGPAAAEAFSYPYFATAKGPFTHYSGYENAALVPISHSSVHASTAPRLNVVGRSSGSQHARRADASIRRTSPTATNGGGEVPFLKASDRKGVSMGNEIREEFLRSSFSNMERSQSESGNISLGNRRAEFTGSDGAAVGKESTSIVNQEEDSKVSSHAMDGKVDSADVIHADGGLGSVKGIKPKTSDEGLVRREARQVSTDVAGEAHRVHKTSKESEQGQVQGGAFAISTNVGHMPESAAAASGTERNHDGVDTGNVLNGALTGKTPHDDAGSRTEDGDAIANSPHDVITCVASYRASSANPPRDVSTCKDVYDASSCKTLDEVSVDISRNDVDDRKVPNDAAVGGTSYDAVAVNGAHGTAANNVGAMGYQWNSLQKGILGIAELSRAECLRREALHVNQLRRKVLKLQVRIGALSQAVQHHPEVLTGMSPEDILVIRQAGALYTAAHEKASLFNEEQQLKEMALNASFSSEEGSVFSPHAVQQSRWSIDDKEHDSIVAARVSLEMGQTQISRNMSSMTIDALVPSDHCNHESYQDCWDHDDRKNCEGREDCENTEDVNAHIEVNHMTEVFFSSGMHNESTSILTVASRAEPSQQRGSCHDVAGVCREKKGDAHKNTYDNRHHNDGDGDSYRNDGEGVDVSTNEDGKVSDSGGLGHCPQDQQEYHDQPITPGSSDPSVHELHTSASHRASDSHNESGLRHTARSDRSTHHFKGHVVSPDNGTYHDIKSVHTSNSRHKKQSASPRSEKQPSTISIRSQRTADTQKEGFSVNDVENFPACCKGSSEQLALLRDELCEVRERSCELRDELAELFALLQSMFGALTIMLATTDTIMLSGQELSRQAMDVDEEFQRLADEVIESAAEDRALAILEDEYGIKLPCYDRHTSKLTDEEWLGKKLRDAALQMAKEKFVNNDSSSISNHYSDTTNPKDLNASSHSTQCSPTQLHYSTSQPEERHEDAGAHGRSGNIRTFPFSSRVIRKRSSDRRAKWDLCDAHESQTDHAPATSRSVQCKSSSTPQSNTPVKNTGIQGGSSPSRSVATDTIRRSGCGPDSGVDSSFSFRNSHFYSDIMQPVSAAAADGNLTQLQQMLHYMHKLGCPEDTGAGADRKASVVRDLWDSYQNGGDSTRPLTEDPNYVLRGRQYGTPATSVQRRQSKWYYLERTPSPRDVAPYTAERQPVQRTYERGGRDIIEFLRSLQPPPPGGVEGIRPTVRKYNIQTAMAQAQERARSRIASTSRNLFGAIFASHVKEHVLPIAAAADRIAKGQPLDLPLLKAIRELRTEEERRQKRQADLIFRRVATNIRSRHLLQQPLFHGSAFPSYVAVLYDRWRAKLEEEEQEQKQEQWRSDTQLLRLLGVGLHPHASSGYRKSFLPPLSRPSQRKLRTGHSSSLRHTLKGFSSYHFSGVSLPHDVDAPYQH